MNVGQANGPTRRQWLAGSLCAGLLPLAWANGTTSTVGTGYQVSDWPRQRPRPPFEALSLHNDPVDLSGFQGKVLLLNFWATWCPPCRAELPSLQALPEWFGEEKVAVLALNFQEAGRTVRRFMESSGLSLPVALDASGAIARAWGVRAFPTTVVIDRKGRPQRVIQGEVDWVSPVALGWIERQIAAP